MTAVSPPCTATEDGAALPGTPHPQGRRLEPAPSPSELLIGIFFFFPSGAAVLELTPAGSSGTPAARAGSSEEKNTARGRALSFVHHQQ